MRQNKYRQAGLNGPRGSMAVAETPRPESNLPRLTPWSAPQRIDLMEDLYARYGDRSEGNFRMQGKYFRMTLLRKFVIGGSNFLKRFIVIAAAATITVALFPILLPVAPAIHLTGRGPILSRQSRVGQWGVRVSFPTFRSVASNWKGPEKQVAGREPRERVSVMNCE